MRRYLLLNLKALLFIMRRTKSIDYGRHCMALNKPRVRGITKLIYIFWRMVSEGVKMSLRSI